MRPYELMYILSSGITEEETEKTADEITSAIQKLGGIIEREERFGRRKLAYPIKHTRNGFYVLAVFSMEQPAVATLERKIRTTPSVIRYLVVNMEEARVRMARDQVKKETARAREGTFMSARALEAEMTPVAEPLRPARSAADGQAKINIEEEIEKALKSEDITK